MRRARVSRVIAAGLALFSALGLAARADALLLSDSFTANNTDVSTFNNTLASDQAGSVATVSYSLAGYDAGAQILTEFFHKELAQYLDNDLDPLGRKIIECCLTNGSVEDYMALLPHTVISDDF